MKLSFPEARWLLVPAFLGIQAWAAHFAIKPERLPLVPNLAAFPNAIGDWTQSASDPLPSDLLAAVNADAVLSRSYESRRDHYRADLLVAWFQTQTAGDRQPHSPKVCLPGAGWTPTDHGEFDLDTSDGKIPVNFYLVTSRGAHYALLYWYQTPRRVVAGEWASKFWIVPDAVRDHRTDVALVRIAVPYFEKEQAPLAAASNFARLAYVRFKALLQGTDRLDSSVQRSPL